MTKKLLSTLIVLIFILGTITIPASAATRLSFTAENATVLKGGNVIVTINCTSPEKVSWFAFTGSWDTTALTYVSYELVNITSDTSFEISDGTFKYQTLRDANADMTFNSTAIVKITLQAKANITGVKEDTTIHFTGPVFEGNVDAGMNAIDDADIAFIDGTVSIVDQHTVPSISDLTITGDAKVGSTLKADYNFTDNYTAPDASTYVWYADDVVIEGAAAKEYEVKPADFGKIIKVKVTPTVEATEDITDNLTGEAVTSDETAAVTIDPAVKVDIAEDILTNVVISGATNYVKAGKEYEVKYVNSVPAIDYTDNLKLKVYILENENDVVGNDTSEALENQVTITGLKFKVEKSEASKFIKVILVAEDGAEDGQETAVVKEFASLLIKNVKTSSSSVGSTGPSLANKDDKEDVVNTDDDKDDVDVDDDDKNTDPSTGLKFTDVPNEVYYWAIDAIKNLTEDGIIIGKSETAFDPSGEVTRAEFVAFLVRGLDFEEADTTKFTDVAADFWGIKEIATAEKAGIFDYIEGETFSPNEVLTRDEMALIAYNVAKAADIKLPELQGSVKFDDADAINPNAVEAVDALSKAGIILGNGDGTFAPKGTTIRAAAAKVVNMILVLAK